MPYWLRNILKFAGVLVGLLVIFLVLSQVSQAVRTSVQTNKTETAQTMVQSSYISADPFGAEASILSPGQQYFYNMKVQKHAGITCYINISWRWILKLPAGDIVYWTDSAGGESATSSNNIPNVAQAFTTPAKLVPGRYTLNRLSVYKCGDDDDYARTVRTTDVLVK